MFINKIKMNKGNISSETTVKQNAATKYGTLKELSNKVLKKAIYRWKIEKLKFEKVGTTEIEHRAVGTILGEEGIETVIVKGKKFKRKKAIANLIPEIRDPKKVVDLLELEMRYAKEEERKCRQEYRSQKKRMKEECNTRGKMRRFSRMVEKVAHTISKKWELELAKAERKVRWLKEKYGRHRKRKKGSDWIRQETEEEWIERMAVGSGRNRKRIKVKVPVYGGVVG